jgi:hypothetical protein
MGFSLQMMEFFYDVPLFSEAYAGPGESYSDVVLRAAADVGDFHTSHATYAAH